MNNEHEFNYYYSAGDRLNIETLKKKYADVITCPPSFTELQKLDRAVSGPGKTVCLIAAITGIFTLGGGMSMILKGSNALFLPGTAIGILGLILIGSAYPLCLLITKKRKQLLAPLIRSMADHLLNDQ